MHLPMLFGNRSTNKEAAQSENLDDAPVHDQIDMNQRIQAGWKMAQSQQKYSYSNVKSKVRQRFDIRGAAMGMNNTNSEIKEISRKIDDGWKRSLNTNAVREKVRTTKRENIRSAAFGFGSSKEDKNEESYEIQTHLEEGMKRAAKMKGIAPELEVKGYRRNKTGIRSAAMGISSVDEQKLGSSSSLDEAREIQNHLEDGMKRAAKMKGIAPESEVKGHRRNKAGIRSAAMGITNVDESKLGSSSSLDEAQDIQNHLDEGMKRAEKMRGIAPEAEVKAHRRNKAGIRSAAMGISNTDDPIFSDSSQRSSAEELKERLENGMKRADQMRDIAPQIESKSHHRNRPDILSAAIGIKPLDEPQQKIEHLPKLPLDKKTSFEKDTKDLKKNESITKTHVTKPSQTITPIASSKPTPGQKKS